MIKELIHKQGVKISNSGKSIYLHIELSPSVSQKLVRVWYAGEVWNPSV